MTRRIVCGLDFETTGLDQAKGHRIIEIGAVMRDLTTGAQLGVFETRINPQRGIDPDAQEVHGIAFEDLVDKPLIEDVAPRLVKLLDLCEFTVTHNGEGFDLPFLYGELLRIGVPTPRSLGSIDTMVQGRWATGDGSVPSLRALCFASGVPYDPEKAHGALYDVNVMLDCFFKQYPRGFFTLPTTPYEYNPAPKKEKS